MFAGRVGTLTLLLLIASAAPVLAATTLEEAGGAASAAESALDEAGQILDEAGRTLDEAGADARAEVASLEEEVSAATSEVDPRDDSGTEDEQEADASENGSHASSEDPSEGGSGSGSSGSSDPDPVKAAGWARDRAVQVVDASTRDLGLLVTDALKEVNKARDSAALPVTLLPESEGPTGESAYEPSTTTTEGSQVSTAVMVATAATAAGAGLLIFWITGSSASGAGSSIAAKSGASAAKRVAPVFSPLFTRFEGRKVLEHPNREALYAKIAEEPGVRLQDLCDATGLSRTAVTHHLRLLENQHLVVSRRVGRSRHYYENGGRFERGQKDAYAVLQNERSRSIAAFIRSHPGTIQKGLCEALGVRASIAHWHVKRLQEADLVEAVREGRTVSYYPAAAMSQVRV